MLASQKIRARCSCGPGPRNSYAGAPAGQWGSKPAPSLHLPGHWDHSQALKSRAGLVVLGGGSSEAAAAHPSAVLDIAWGNV